MIDKQRLKQLIIENLTEQINIVRASLDNAIEATTHDDAKQEGKYDTRAIETGYLAHAQSMRLKELEDNLNRLHRCQYEPLSEEAQVQDGALVTVDIDGSTMHYFLTNAIGGMKLVLNDITISVVKTTSGIGEALMDLEVGESWAFGKLEGEITDIS